VSVTYMVYPGYDMQPEQWDGVLEELDRIKRFQQYDLLRLCANTGCCFGGEEYEELRQITSNWLQGNDPLAVQVDHEEKSIRLMVSGSGPARVAKEIHRKTIALLLLQWAVENRVNLCVKAV